MSADFKKILSYLSLLVICLGSASLVLPTIGNNINNPNMIVYFSSDEGGLMDVIWHYFSGVKRPSFQWDFDYGLEMLYLSDFARTILSHFINFIPGTFVLILRWIHLIAWVCALIALWRLVSYHFRRIWLPVLAVILLAVRPAFAYFSVNLKPEPLVLFFMIVGLDYALRIAERPSKRNLFIAIAFAALAFVVKYAGIFLLPAIVASMYFSELYQQNIGKRHIIFPRLKLFWILPALCGLVFIAIPLAIVFFYVRKSTGTTWYQEYGIWRSLLQNKAGLYSFVVGASLIFLSPVTWALNRMDNNFLKRVTEWVKTISSFALITGGIFIGFAFLFGLRWLFNPKHFILVYAFLGSTAPTESINILATKGFLYAFFQNLITRIVEVDFILFLLFIFYLGIEIYYWRKNLKGNPLQLYKRLVLLIFLVPFLMLVCSMMRFTLHHMLPFSVAMIILALVGIDIFLNEYNGKKSLKDAIVCLISILLVIDVGFNGASVIKTRIHQFNQKYDIAYEVAGWFKENIPLNAKVIAEHYSSVYIPPEYKNIKTLDWNLTDRDRKLRKLAQDYKPQFIYYNENPYDGQPLMPIREMLPGKKVKLVKSFDSSGRRYQRKPGDKFVIYEVLD